MKIENSYKDGKRIETGSSDAEWEVWLMSWGWDAIQRTGPEPRGRKNFPKFDQAEAHAMEQSTDIIRRSEASAARHLRQAEALEREANGPTAESNSLRWIAELNLQAASVLRAEKRGATVRLPCSNGLMLDREGAFTFVEGGEEVDAGYELKSNPDITIQVAEYAGGFLVHRWDEEEGAQYHHGSFPNLDDAKNAALNLNETPKG